MNYEINDIYRDEKYNYYICKKNGLFHTHDFYNTHLLDIPKHVKPSKKEDLGNLLYVNNLENLKEITELEYKALYCKKNKVVTFTTIKRSKKLTCLTPKENLSIYDKKFNSFTNSLLKDIIEFQTIIKYHFFWKKNDDYSKINDREIKFIVYFLKELNNYIILKDLINIAYFQAEDFNKIEKTISKKEITMKSPEFVFNEIQKYSVIENAEEDFPIKKKEVKIDNRESRYKKELYKKILNIVKDPSYIKEEYKVIDGRIDFLIQKDYISIPIEIKHDNSSWTHKHIENQLEKYKKHFGVMPLLASPNGSYGLSEEELLNKLESILA